MLPAAEQQRSKGQGPGLEGSSSGLLAMARLPSPYMTQHSHVQMVCFLQGKVAQALTRLALGIGPGIVDHVPALYDEFFALQLCGPQRTAAVSPN